MFPWDKIIVGKSFRERLQAMADWPSHAELLTIDELEIIRGFVFESGHSLHLITDCKGQIKGSFIGDADESLLAEWEEIQSITGKTLSGLRWLMIGSDLVLEELSLKEQYIFARYGFDILAKADLTADNVTIFYPEVANGCLSYQFILKEQISLLELTFYNPERQVQQLEGVLREEQALVVESDQERVLLVGLDLPVRNRKGLYPVEESISELEQLTLTAGAEVVGRVIQPADIPHTAYYIGPGKAQELKYRVFLRKIDTLIFDDELSPAQQRNLEQLLQVKIVDRSRLILDIFAQHARTREGKLQVELAQLKYMLPRLTGLGQQLSRLGGGIGTRGPGESKLEQDRQRIRKRIHDLEQEIKQVAELRELHHQGRKLPVVALVGYTNAGKSTVLNTLTNAGVLAENKLFATLDPTMRKLELGTSAVLLSDTVGFIQKLPHHLVAAFKATLEEVKRADLLLHIVDSSHPERELQMRAVLDVLGDLEVLDKPIITVFNKADLIDLTEIGFLSERYQPSGVISAFTRQGLPELLDLVRTEVEQNFLEIEILLPYGQGSWVERLHKFGSVITEEYRNEGIYLKARVEPALASQLEKYSLVQQ